MARNARLGKTPPGKTRARPAPPAGPDATKQRILDAAERLFAERGFRGTSLRAVTSRARVNLAAVHYHFGSKEALLEATLERHVAPVNAERLRRLAALEARPGRGRARASVEEILDAFLRPVVEMQHASAERAEELRRVAAILHCEPVDVIGPLARRLFGECAQRFADALSRALPELSPAEVWLRFQLVVGVMIHVISGRFRSGPDSAVLGQLPEEGLLEALVAFAGAGLRAPAQRARRGAA